MTLKVMLVDDELLVRLGIKSLIDWEKHGFEFIGDAPDGEKALELMEQSVPDILLTDIVMPRMNGLQLIERVRAQYPSMLIIVLSSHNEFDYVRSAMKLGVEDYMLKTSMKPDELLEILVEAAGKIARTNVKTQPEAAAISARQDTRMDEVTDCVRSILTGDPAGAEVPAGLRLQPQCMLLLLHVLHTRDGGPEASAMKLLEHLVQTELEALLDSHPVTVDSRDIAAVLAVPEEKLPDLDRQISGLVSSAQVLLGISLRAETAGPLSAWEELPGAYAKTKSGILDQGMQLTSRQDINSLLTYIKDNLTRDISLKEAAERINISETYLSTIFKKETGMGFTDWINTMRIEQAASLLMETSLPSYLIAEQVGYENINYFGRLFKKMKGVSPQKYRAQFQKTKV
ncbi:response regulator transcription factor [Paenibacillus chibensis]|uniref:response regulator transcription factor n=1 Tax=Paenibacillus chibensis TaxID=59846 RepID=UPI0013E2CAD1|nr:response regulator [Paenibacillus chibensis]MEC0368977.1 response regulator [Paenibacillus chibensis]